MKSLLPRGTCGGCREIVEYLPDGRPAPHTIEAYSSADKAAADVPCPGNDHPIEEMPPEGFDGRAQRLYPATWTRLSGSGDPGVEVFLMLDGRNLHADCDGPHLTVSARGESVQRQSERPPSGNGGRCWLALAARSGRCVRGTPAVERDGQAAPVPPPIQ